MANNNPTGGELSEVHFAIVTGNNDPEKRGRLKLRSQSLTGADFELPDWVEPEGPTFTSIDGGSALWIPKINSVVELVVAVHDAGMDQVNGERFLQNPSGRWRAATPSKTGGKMPLAPDLQKNYPNRRGFVTPAGIKVIFDDTKGSEMLLLEDTAGNQIRLDKNSLHVKSPTKIVLVSPVEVGEGATERMVLGDIFMALYNAHTHPTGVGPSGAPVPLMTATQLSQEGNKVK